MRPRAGLLALIAILGTSASVSAPVLGADPIPGGQGTDTSLPLTDSAVTVNGRDQFSDLAITVNQTRNLNNQAISVTWTGGTPTNRAAARFGEHFLQIMQCWGDDDGTVPDNAGPPPEQCVFGATAGTFGGPPASLYPSAISVSRVISKTNWDNFVPNVGHVDPGSLDVWRPFRAVDGVLVNAHTDPNFNPSLSGGNFWLNPYFDVVTSNEIGAAATGPDGKGAELFQVNTGVESAGLGCGQRVQPVESGDRVTPRCWLVIVPRGAAVDENVGTVEWGGVLTSPLAPAAWANRIAIPLEFNPVDPACSLADEERRIAGNELALAAVANWQPALCAEGDLPPYVYAPVGDDAARQQLTSGTQGAPGMVAVSRSIDSALIDAANPVIYAPITLSGLAIGFNVERRPRFDAPDAELELAGVRVADLNLTPRLVAKLLTQSYRHNVGIANLAPPYPWLTDNPGHIGEDPDFLRFNPEFTFLLVGQRQFSGLSLPAGNSDAARLIWEWVFADPEARTWLAGTPDEWGMRVNPVYSTDPALNPNGVAFGQPLPTSFPKSDPHCHQAPSRTFGGVQIIPPPLCGTDWIPYVRSFEEAARLTRAANDGARIIENPFPSSSSNAWVRDNPQPPGSRTVLSVTDTPSAVRYGLQVARLSRAGDNGSTRDFVAPGRAGLRAGLRAMQPGEEPTVLEPSPDAVSTGAYPLTMLTYAAIAPLGLDAQARAEYAAFIDYAAIPGQVSGLELGQLPAGYEPLPAALRSQAAVVAAIVRDPILIVPEEPTTTTTTTVPPSTSTTAPPTTIPATTAPPTVPEAPLPPLSGTLPPQGGLTGSTPVGNAPRESSEPSETDEPTTEEPDDATVTEDAPPRDAVEREPPPPDDEEPTGSTFSPATPLLALSRSRFAVPSLGVVALGSALGALELTKRPRRSVAGSEPDALGLEGGE